jgi:hypothetical protein
MKKILCLIVSALVFFTTGCMNFNNSKFAYKEHEPAKHKPVIEIKVERFYDYSKFATPSPLSNDVGFDVLNKILNTWKDKDFIKEYGAVASLQSKADYILTLSGDRKLLGSLPIGMLTACTLGVIPSRFEWRYNLQLEIKNKKTNKKYGKKIAASYVEWTSILLVPIWPFGMIGSNNMFNDASMYSYSEFRKQGVFNNLDIQSSKTVGKYASSIIQKH